MAGPPSPPRSPESTSDESLPPTYTTLPRASPPPPTTPPSGSTSPAVDTPPSVTMSRSRLSRDSLGSLADRMLRASLSRSSDGDRMASVSDTRRSSTLTSSDLVIITPPASPPLNDATLVSNTTIPTSERLRQAEQERDELRKAVVREQAKAAEAERVAEKERALADRLKREGGSTGSALSAADIKNRILELERDTRAARAEMQRVAPGMFKAACSTDLLFLMDTTLSMSSYINAAKKQVLDIVDDIKKAFLNEAEVRIAVVGYKDHKNSPNIEFLDFTTSAEAVRTFIGKLAATGGADIPEDVLGGVEQALNASWKQQTRCIIHIADAPPHGRTNHDYSDSEDDYADTGSEPHGLTYEPLINRMTSQQINYALLRINGSTDRMALNFSKCYAAANADATLHRLNKYAALRTTGGSQRKPMHNVTKALLFEESELGTTYSALRRLVVRTVTSSASRTAVRVSTGRSSKAWTSKTMNKSLTMTKEEDDIPAEQVRLETATPQWNTAGWLDEKMVVEGFSPNVGVHGASTLDDMMAKDDNIKMSVSELTIYKRGKPFAQGAMRLAYYARTAASINQYVVKAFKKSGKHLPHLVEDMRCQALCKAFALEFNALSEEESPLDFIATTSFKGKSDKDSEAAENCLSIEPFIQGSYVKYNNNCGYVNERDPNDRFNQAAQAFSHFTFERSQGRFLVCDLQGVGCVLTDPAIHTLDPERFTLTDANLGSDGFKFFFSTHVCNDICTKLKLRSNASMLRTGSFDFRRSWPPMDKITCCSNKLCGRIVRKTSAMRSDKYPGYYWCASCWPQLAMFNKRWMCVGASPDHEFEASTFFYESQGRRAPRKCQAHREGAEKGLEIAVATGRSSGSIWAKLRGATKMKSRDY